MIFRITTRHVEEAPINMKTLLKRNGIKIIDLLEAEILKDEDNSKVEDIYLLHCESSTYAYLRFKIKYRYDKIIHEGFRTLIGRA